jgi:hypothetical protein
VTEIEVKFSAMKTQRAPAVGTTPFALVALRQSSDGQSSVRNVDPARIEQACGYPVNSPLTTAEQFLADFDGIFAPGPAKSVA